MEELESMLHNIHITRFDLQTEHWVHITHIITPHDFYVRPTQYRIFIHKIETSQPLTKPFSLNEYDTVIFDMTRSGNNVQYARGRICYKQVDGTTIKYDIFAMDYGSLHKAVAEKYIWECNERLLKLPPLALYCQLGNCVVRGNKNWTEEAIDTFKLFVENERAKMIILDKSFDKLIVELRNSNPDDIATLMAYCGYTTLGYVHNAISRMPTFTPTKMFYTFKTMKVNDRLHVRVQSGKSHNAFYVADVNDYQNFKSESENIRYYAKKEPKLREEQFQMNTPVFVKDDLNGFDRGIITKIITDTKAIVKLVDTGKEVEAHFLNMKSMPEQCFKIPVLAIYCSAAEKQILDLGFYRFFHPGSEHLIQIKQLGIEFESPNIVDIFPLQGCSSKN